MVRTEIPPVLIEQLQEDNLILFAGAGISVGSGLPTGRELAFQLRPVLGRGQHGPG